MKKDIALISGALSTPDLWQHQVKLMQNTLNVHHVDVLNSQSVTAMAERFAKIAPDEFTLIGFSLGGYVALELFRYIPHKIKKLILINSSASSVSAKGRSERERSIDLINRGKFDFLISLIFKNSIHDQKKHGDLLPLVQQMAKEVGSENYKYQLMAIIDKPDQSDLLSSIDCPTLLIANKHDKVMPYSCSENLARQIKGAELIKMENCGHLAMLEQPEAINQILSGWL